MAFKLKRAIRPLYPPATLGIVGGGQLGRMMAMAAKQQGYRVLILDPKVNCPAGQVSDAQVVADFDDQEALEKLALQADVITFEFEHISAKGLMALEAKGHTVIPSGATLRWIQHKGIQKQRLKNYGLPVPDFLWIDSYDQLLRGLAAFGGKAVLKRCTEGYDGKGNAVVDFECDLEAIYASFSDTELILEAFVPFKKEVSILVALGQGATGVQVETYPVAENFHQDNILLWSQVPATLAGSVSEGIQAVARQVCDAIGDLGLYCIELFVLENGEVLINEIAPRPHNSGHYSIEATVTSQYEQIVRIVTGMPLGPSTLISPCAMVNVLGDAGTEGDYQVVGIQETLSQDRAYLHLYGKAHTGPKKKLGHITVLADTLDQAFSGAKTALKALSIKPKTQEDPNNG